MSKANKTPILSLFLLSVSYFLTRYVFLELHGMKQWPLVLFLFCLAILIVCFLKKAHIVSLVTSVSYLLGFVLGELFQTNGVDQGGGTTNNMWLIWTSVILVGIIVSIVLEVIRKKKSRLT